MKHQLEKQARGCMAGMRNKMDTGFLSLRVRDQHLNPDAGEFRTGLAEITAIPPDYQSWLGCKSRPEFLFRMRHFMHRKRIPTSLASQTLVYGGEFLTRQFSRPFPQAITPEGTQNHPSMQLVTLPTTLVKAARFFLV